MENGIPDGRFWGSVYVAVGGLVVERDEAYANLFDVG